MTSERPVQVPRPPHPDQRRKPLPWQRPKPAEEDPDAPRAVDVIRACTNYRLAEQDVDYLAREDLRGMRLELEYLRADTILREHGVDHTIVVFGSTRIPEPMVARRMVEALRAAQSVSPNDKAAGRRLATAERLLAKSHYYDVAREFGRLVGNAGGTPGKPRLAVVTGGGPGMMEAANRGAFDVGAKSVGLNIDLPHEQFPNPYITPELCFLFHYFALRKMHFMMRARALVAFPGGFGTLDELTDALTLIQTKKIEPMPIILFGTDYWKKLLNIDFLVEEGMIEEHDAKIVAYLDTAEEAVEFLAKHHREDVPLNT